MLRAAGARLGRWARSWVPLVLIFSSVEPQSEEATLAFQTKRGKWLMQNKDCFRALVVSLLVSTPRTN